MRTALRSPMRATTFWHKTMERQARRIQPSALIVQSSTLARFSCFLLRLLACFELACWPAVLLSSGFFVPLPSAASVFRFRDVKYTRGTGCCTKYPNRLTCVCMILLLDQRPTHPITPHQQVGRARRCMMWLQVQAMVVRSRCSSQTLVSCRVDPSRRMGCWPGCRLPRRVISEHAREDGGEHTSGPAPGSRAAFIEQHSSWHCMHRAAQ